MVLDPDDRRFFVLDIPSHRKEDITYFNAIHQQLSNGGYEALMYDLLNENLSEFDPKIMPENFAGFAMKMEGASSIDRYIYTSIKESCWDHANIGPSSELQNITIDKFYEHYKAWCEHERQTISRKEQLGKRLRELIPRTMTKRTPREEDAKRPAFYVFPSLAECRFSIEKAYKQTSEIWEWA